MSGTDDAMTRVIGHIERFLHFAHPIKVLGMPSGFLSRPAHITRVFVFSFQFNPETLWSLVTIVERGEVRPDGKHYCWVVNPLTAGAAYIRVFIFY